MKKRVLPIVFCILLLLTTSFLVRSAESGSITVLFEHETKPVAEASFSIYKAAELNGDKYTFTPSFSNYSVRMAIDPGSEDWQALASTLSAYAARDKIEPLAFGTTDNEGKLCFAGLSEGLYLLIGSKTESGDTRLFPQPMLVSVPFTKENSEKDYEVVTEPKYEARNITEETLSRKALKIWNDKGNESKRPQDITVQLLCDGDIYEEQVLNSQNNWSYTWEGLNASHDWQLTEKDIAKDYTVDITREGIVFTVTNTNDDPPPAKPSEPILPQTGLLWWPVPVLAAAGAVSLFIGVFLLLRKREYDA